MSLFNNSPNRLIALSVFTLVLASTQLTAQITSSPQSPSPSTPAAPSAADVISSSAVNAGQNSQAAAVDFVNAQPITLPLNPNSSDFKQALKTALDAIPNLGPSGSKAGTPGNGNTNPVFLGTPQIAASTGIASQDFGTQNHPFTTVRADLYGNSTSTSYPYSAAGKLFFNIGSSSYICSASLIAPGVVVTAAHCVANYGQRQFYSNWQFVPGYSNGYAPFGVWSASNAWILASYYYGTDSCSVYGVVCPDDVAVLVLDSPFGDYAGYYSGWLGYWYGGGFTSSGLTHITQLGYPAGLDYAAYMERTDSYGYTNSSLSNNTIIGSNMDGGSSGGPWIANFGLPSGLTGETSGSFAPGNVVIGVTSWGYTSTAPKEQGAAPFTGGNIPVLLNAACSSIPGAC